MVAGPGSFTGLRVGLSAVKAMAEVTGKPILTLSRLAILASMAARLPSSERGVGAVHVVLDAGRGEFYLGVYRDAGKTRVAESFETLAALEEKISQDHRFGDRVGGVREGGVCFCRWGEVMRSAGAVGARCAAAGCGGMASGTIS